jgi:hypothetical protein
MHGGTQGVVEPPLLLERGPQSAYSHLSFVQ